MDPNDAWTWAEAFTAVGGMASGTTVICALIWAALRWNRR
jgi:hypothetical protein